MEIHIDELLHIFLELGILRSKYLKDCRMMNLKSVYSFTTLGSSLIDNGYLSNILTTT